MIENFCNQISFRKRKLKLQLAPETTNSYQAVLFERSFIENDQETALAWVEVPPELLTITYNDFMRALKRYSFLNFLMTQEMMNEMG